MELERSTALASLASKDALNKIAISVIAVSEKWRKEAQSAKTELAIIAKANPREWGGLRDSFQLWAQNRARYALAALTPAEEAQP